MKKAIVSSLCSAFIIPGLGQVLNQQLKKAGIILGAVFVLFVAIIIKLYKVVESLAAKIDLASATPADVSAHIRETGLGLLAALLILFGLLWIYSVVDAFYWGLKAEQLEGDRKDEGIHP